MGHELPVGASGSSSSATGHKQLVPSAVQSKQNGNDVERVTMVDLPTLGTVDGDADYLAGNPVGNTRTAQRANGPIRPSRDHP